MNDSIIRRIASNGIIAAIYFLTTYLTYSISFMGIQVRIAECLILLCFFRRDYTIGLTLGCLIANLISPIGVWDILFGTLATLVSCLLISFMRQMFLATLIPVIINGFVVGAELNILLQEPFWYNVGTVALGEFIAISVIGYILFMILGRRESFLNLIRAQRNFKFKW